MASMRARSTPMPFSAIRPEARVQAVPQNWTLMGPIIACDRKLTEGNFVHADQPILAWAVSNAKVETHKNAFTITKQASGTAKIDPLMAVFDAAALMARNPMAGGYVTEAAVFL
jgi:phage terminase large subunit-like protein